LGVKKLGIYVNRPSSACDFGKKSLLLLIPSFPNNGMGEGGIKENDKWKDHTP
jgi:hypothetical protein